MREISWLLLPAFLLVAVITALDGPAPDLRLELNGQNLLRNQIERAGQADREQAYYGRTDEQSDPIASVPAFSVDLNEHFRSLQTETERLAVSLDQSLRLFIDDIQSEAADGHQAAKRLATTAWRALKDA